MPRNLRRGWSRQWAPAASRLLAPATRAARNVAARLAGAADDALAVAGVACLAVAAGYVSPAGPWLVAGIFLFVSSAAGTRRAP